MSWHRGQSGYEWARLLAPDKLELVSWSLLRPACELRLHDLHGGIEREAMISPASTTMSLWDGIVPDPVDPTGLELDS